MTTDVLWPQFIGQLVHRGLQGGIDLAGFGNIQRHQKRAVNLLGQRSSSAQMFAIDTGWCASEQTNSIDCNYIGTG